MYYLKGEELNYIGKLHYIHRKTQWKISFPIGLMILKKESNKEYRDRLYKEISKSYKNIERMQYNGKN